MYWVEKGVDIDKIKYIRAIKKHRGKADDIYTDNIMCFDIEVSSVFIRDGKAMIFDPSKSEEFYSECDKTSIVYVWQFSIDDNVYMGRTLDDFKNFLLKLEKTEPYYKVVYIHNFSYEFQFLRNILQFDYVFAREKRKPIFSKWKTYEFRCSYLLTRLSLENWGVQKNLTVKKLVGDINYNVLRTPYTKLTQKEIEYCVNDCLVMYYGLKQYKERYGSIYKIPYTQTGEVRKVIQEKMQTEVKYRKKCAILIPSTINEYKELISAFYGGYTHANYIHSGIIKEDVRSRDISSSYPWVMLSEKFPMSKFVKIPYNERFLHNKRYSYLISFEAWGIRSKLWNTFLSKSKCLNCINPCMDNGRVISADYICISAMTNIDYELFLQCYDIEKINILSFKISHNDFLNPVLRKYIIELYSNKTSLKNVAGKEESYMVQKQFINSLFGMMVTRDITDDIIFTDHWDKQILTDDTFKEKIDKQRKNLKKCFNAFQFGVYVTAYARKNLWTGILNLDYDVIYCDTDSIKYINNHDSFFNEYNKNIEKKCNEIANQLAINPDDLNPKDSKGIAHRIGIFDDETAKEHYRKFKTLGAKKYIIEDSKGLHMTVSGVRKDAVSQISSIDQFNEGLVFDIDHAKKNLLHYNEDQPIFTYNKGKYDEWTDRNKYGITFQPTTYKLGLSLDYYALLYSSLQDRETEIFKNVSRETF